MENENLHQTIDALRILIDQNELRTRERFSAADKALEIAMTANEKRFDNTNEWRATLGDQSNKMITRVEALSVMQQQNLTTIAELKPLHEKIEAYTKPNYQLWFGAVSGIVALVTAMWLIVGLKIDTSNAPLSLNLEQVKTTQQSYDRQLNDLDTQLRHVETQNSESISERGPQVAIVNEKLVQVETQFCASDIVRNLMHANDLRVLSVMWHEIYPKSQFPTNNAYYPTICNKTPG
jgi:hypothetical protein